MAEGDPARRRDGGVVTGTVIDVGGLTHRFGTTLALDGVDLRVGAGEVYGFLGRNGAGKTTLIRALLGLLAPTAGQVRLLGTPVRAGRTPARLWQRVGYLVEGPGLYPTLTVTDHLAIAAGYRGLPRRALTDVLERLSLGGFADVPARALSLGNRQRLGLALALVHRPAVVVLDEPVNGLDPAGVVEVRDLVRSLAADGVTVFMSSHLVYEVARLADRVGVIHAGRLVAELDGERLAGRQRLVSGFRDPALASRALRALRAQGFDAAAADDDRLEVRDPVALAAPDRVAEHLVRAGAPPMSLAVEREDLEDLFLRLTEEVPA